MHTVPDGAVPLRLRDILPVAIIRKLIALEDAGPYKSSRVMTRIWYRTDTHYHCAVYYKLGDSIDSSVADDVTMYTIE